MPSPLGHAKSVLMFPKFGIVSIYLYAINVSFAEILVMNRLQVKSHLKRIRNKVNLRLP